MKNNFFKITASNKFQAVIAFLRQQLGLKAGDPLVSLYSSGIGARVGVIWRSGSGGVGPTMGARGFEREKGRRTEESGSEGVGTRWTG
jgi:hypothetical protein